MNEGALEAGSDGLRERNKRDKLSRIRAAALELFVSKGFDDTTTREIAARAGVGLGTVFVYAETKRDLLFLLVNDDLEDCIGRSLAALRADGSLYANLMAVMRIHFEYFGRLPVLSRQALREMYFYQEGKQSARFLATRAGLGRLMQDLVERAMAARLIHTDAAPDDVTRVLFAIYQVELRRWLASEEPDLEAGLAGLGRQLRVVLDGLAPRPEALPGAP
jgi:TetR/AcrR family transcriptional regulator, cholesterol catabolism regulator